MIFNEAKLPNSEIYLYRSGMFVINSGHRSGNPESLMKRTDIPRKFSISKQKVRSALIELWNTKKSKHLLFITYTFAFDITETDASRVWQNHLDNLSKTFKVKGYVWVKELQKSGRIHFHLVADVHRVDIKKLQNSFNNSVLSVNSSFAVSNNSVRLGEKPIIYSIKIIAGYLSKYISKEKQYFDKRAYGYTQMNLYRIIDIGEFLQLVRDKKCFIYCDEPYLYIGVIRNFYDVPGS